jgi:hypothetical protein
MHPNHFSNDLYACPVQLDVQMELKFPILHSTYSVLLNLVVREVKPSVVAGSF